jgi:hypothetical protein
MRKEAVGTRSRGFTLTERVQEEWLAMVCGQAFSHSRYEDHLVLVSSTRSLRLPGLTAMKGCLRGMDRGHGPDHILLRVFSWQKHVRKG